MKKHTSILLICMSFFAFQAQARIYELNSDETVSAQGSRNLILSLVGAMMDSSFNPVEGANGTYLIGLSDLRCTQKVGKVAPGAPKNLLPESNAKVSTVCVVDAEDPSQEPTKVPSAQKLVQNIEQFVKAASSGQNSFMRCGGNGVCMGTLRLLNCNDNLADSSFKTGVVTCKIEMPNY